MVEFRKRSIAITQRSLDIEYRNSRIKEVIGRGIPQQAIKPAFERDCLWCVRGHFRKLELCPLPLTTHGDGSWILLYISVLPAARAFRPCDSRNIHRNP